jgi:hypothetical protein
MKFIERLSWIFFGACALIEGRWLILKAVCWLGWETPDWAAWVQAVGSILAIYAAFMVANSQWVREQSRQRESRQELEESSAKVLSAFIGQAISLYTDLLYYTEDRKKSEIEALGSTFVNVRSGVDQILLRPLPSILIEMAVNVHGDLNRVERAMRRYLASNGAFEHAKLVVDLRTSIEQMGHFEVDAEVFARRPRDHI